MDNQRSKPRASRPDAEIERDVRDALYADVRVDTRDVEATVRDGVVHLCGSVSDTFQKAVAREITDRIKGVRTVDNDLTVKPLSQRSDVEITADIVAAMVRDTLVDERKIDVETRDGVVYLRGVVGSYTERQAADVDARTAPGVLDLVNELTVALVRPRSDEAVAADVQMALESSIAADLSDVQVEVRQGVVYLRGNVGTAAQRWLVDEAIRWTPGVVDVVNDLGVVTLQGP